MSTITPDDPDYASHLAAHVLRDALSLQMIELMDGPCIGMLGDVKVRFTPSGAIHLAQILSPKKPTSETT